MYYENDWFKRQKKNEIFSHPRTHKFTPPVICKRFERICRWQKWSVNLSLILSLEHKSKFRRLIFFFVKIHYTVCLYGSLYGRTYRLYPELQRLKSHPWSRLELRSITYGNAGIAPINPYPWMIHGESWKKNPKRGTVTERHFREKNPERSIASICICFCAMDFFSGNDARWRSRVLDFFSRIHG